jgi:hypothetical protein
MPPSTPSTPPTPPGEPEREPNALAAVADDGSQPSQWAAHAPAATGQGGQAVLDPSWRVRQGEGQRDHRGAQHRRDKRPQR